MTTVTRTQASTLIAALLCLAGPSGPASARDFYVSTFAELSDAIFAANYDPGSSIYLAPGLYEGGALPQITASLSLVLSRVTGAADGSAILGTMPSGSKGILTVPPSATGVRLSVDGLTFRNAAISEAEGGNAAGIRFQSTGAASLIVTNSTFLGNQNGILTGYGGTHQDEELTVTVSSSLFANNGSPGGYTHGIYTQGRILEVSDTTFCGTIGGHDIKSRSMTTNVTNSFFYDGGPSGNAQCGTGSASYSVDLPNGGNGTMHGNYFMQGPGSVNTAIISYGAEGMSYSVNSLVVTGNTFESGSGGRAVQQLEKGSPACLVPAVLSGNIFSPRLMQVSPPGCVAAKQ